MSRTRGNPERPYWLEAWYGPGGRKGTKRNPNRGRVGEREGDLCIAVEYATEDGREIEAQILRDREDIGSVAVGFRGSD